MYLTQDLRSELLCENCFEKVRDLKFQGHTLIVTHQNFDFWKHWPFKHRIEKKS